MNSSAFPYFQTAGDPQNPAIVFLHGGGLSSNQWQPQLQALSDTFYCVAPDLPEQGQSVNIKPFTLQDSARRVVELIKSLPSQKAHVVGLSLGGAVALEVTRSAPDVVDHVMVSGTAAGMSKWLGWLTISSAQLYKLYKPETLVQMGYKQFRIPEQYRASLHDDFIKGFSVDFTRHFTEALMQLQLPAQANLLVTVGEKETVVAKGASRKLATQIKGAKGVTVPNVGHVWNLEAADLFSATVRAFVSDLPLPDGLKAFY
jgi:pimeloyl-ACP methyl ester carboxylesterase